jgi:predicted nucleotidyltransferase
VFTFCLLNEGTQLKLVSLTSEGRILVTLKHGKHTYSELRLETGLSDRWLTVKLGELEAEGVLEKKGRWYGLTREIEVTAYEMSLYMSSQAKQLAEKLADLRFVMAVFLFGSVAQRKPREYSDLDVIVVVDDHYDVAREGIMSTVSKFESDYHVTVEPLILTEEDFLDNVHSSEGGIVYGVAEGFEVLVDKTGRLARILCDRVEDIKRSHDYLEEARIWLKVK